ncbi:MAG: hypothetical protein AB2989_00085 [Candidatus Symbiodolus clandestinus]
MIPNRVDSIQRPQVVEKRSRIGDWEGDTGHGENAYLVTLAKRQSRLVLIGKVVDRQAETVAQCLSE